jgi:hypothetical protein
MSRSRGRRTPRNPSTFGWRVILYFGRRPLFAFIFFYAVVAVLALSPGDQQLQVLLMLTCPWLLALLLILNSPFLASTFRCGAGRWW